MRAMRKIVTLSAFLFCTKISSSEDVKDIAAHEQARIHSLENEVKEMKATLKNQSETIDHMKKLSEMQAKILFEQQQTIKGLGNAAIIYYEALEKISPDFPHASNNNNLS